MEKEPAYKRALRSVQVPYVVDRETGEIKPAFNTIDVDKEEQLLNEKAKEAAVCVVPVAFPKKDADQLNAMLKGLGKKYFDVKNPQDVEILLKYSNYKKEETIMAKTTKKPATKKTAAKKPAAKKAGKK